MVLSTGGGAVLRPKPPWCCAILAMCCICGPRPKIFKRVKHDRTAPAAGEQPLQKLRELYAQRDALYPRSSHLRDRNRSAHGADAGQHDHDAAGDGAPSGRASKPLKSTIKTIAGCALLNGRQSPFWHQTHKARATWAQPCAAPPHRQNGAFFQPEGALPMNPSALARVRTVLLDLVTQGCCLVPWRWCSTGAARCCTKPWACSARKPSPARARRARHGARHGVSHLPP